MRPQTIRTAALAATVLLILGPGRAEAQARPDRGMTVDPQSTAVVVSDPGNDLRGPEGVISAAAEASAVGRRGRENLERLLRVAEMTGFQAYRLEHDHQVAELRKLGFDKVVLTGLSADRRTEAHLRELREQGFEVAVVEDATAAAGEAQGDRRRAAIAELRTGARAVWTTDEALRKLAGT